jgi:hypothetical protein
MHTREEEKKEPSIFAQGIEGWKMVFNAFKKKKPEQQQRQQPQQQEQNDGYSMSNT